MPNPGRSPSGRLRTASTATLPTATPHGETAPTTDRGGKPARTGWELRELVRPLPARRRPPRRKQRSHRFDPALVEYVYNSRFVIASQLHRRFPDWLPSMRTTQRHLARLVDARLLAAAPVRSTGPNFPTVYYATGRGTRLIRETYAGLGREWSGPLTEERKAKGLALDSILHEVLVSEFDLTIQRTVDNRPDLVLLDRERRYFRKDRELTYRQGQRRRRIVPDAGYLPAVRTETGRNLLPMHFLELENGTHSVAKIRSKLRAYTEWADAAAGESLGRLYARFGEPERQPNFRLLLVAHDKYGTVSDERRLLDLMVQSLELPRVMRDRIWLATAEDLRHCQYMDRALDAPIWFRVRDAGRWLGTYRELSETLASELSTTRYTQQREFVSQRMPGLRRHPLFPHPPGAPYPHPIYRTM